MGRILSIAAQNDKPGAVTPGTLLAGSEAVLAGLQSTHSRRAYETAFVAFEAFAGGRIVDRVLLLRWRDGMRRQYSAATVNQRLCAVRKLAAEAQRAGLIAADRAAELRDVAGLHQRGNRVGNWLSLDECRKLLSVPDRHTLKGKRNLCVIAMLLGCALRRYELAGLEVRNLQRRDGRWVLADIEGKGGRVRTVAIPAWLKPLIDDYTKTAGIQRGRLVRRLSGSDDGLSSDSIWLIVREAAAAIGIPNFGPHDLRRTCARLSRASGARLEQIQLMLGHASIQTTQRYLGTEQDLVNAANDGLGL